MSKGMRTCEICGRDFALIVEEHYIATSNEKTGLARLAGGGEPDWYDAIDCPHCGCQQLLHARLRLVRAEIEVEDIDVEVDTDNE